MLHIYRACHDTIYSLDDGTSSHRSSIDRDVGDLASGGIVGTREDLIQPSNRSCVSIAGLIRVSANSVPLILNSRANSAVRSNKLVSIVDRADLIHDCFVREDGHLRHAVIAHDTITVGYSLSDRGAQEVCSILEVFGNVVSKEVDDPFDEGVVACLKEACGIEFSLLVQVVEEELLQLGILASQPEDTCGDETCCGLNERAHKLAGKIVLRE